MRSPRLDLEAARETLLAAGTRSRTTAMLRPPLKCSLATVGSAPAETGEPEPGHATSATAAAKAGAERPRATLQRATRGGPRLARARGVDGRGEGDGVGARPEGRGFARARSAT